MRDYDELVNALRMCDGDVGACWKCPRYGTDDCHGVFGEAADAIEELLARVSENDWRVCKNCSLQHFDTDGMLWCEELSMVVGGNFYCGFFEGSEPPKEVE